MEPTKQYDVVVVGSGTCGAAIARDLSARGARVLVLERGGEAPQRESILSVVSIADEVKVGHKLSTLRVLAAGGSSALYFGVLNDPPLDAFMAIGVDLRDDVAAVRLEVPICELPDAAVGEQSQRLRDAARALGHDWRKHEMLIDSAKIEGDRYTYGALWKAKSHLAAAVENGATLIKHAEAKKILIEDGRAVGVAYAEKGRSRGAALETVRAPVVVLAAGELASPKILRDCGDARVGDRGFYCNPGYALYGIVPEMDARDNFVGSMGCVLDEGIELGDANVSKFMYRLMMLGKFKIGRLFKYPQSIGIGVKVKDGFGGGFTEKGGYHKDFDDADMKKLRRGEAEARKILERAGAKSIYNFGISVAGRVGGFIRIGEQVDADLQTKFRGLYVCDGSIIPDAMRGTPTLTLLAFARRLSRHLATTISA
ncbi:MAG: GMC family oxidoreductase [Lysobacter sp.]|nr:MAG: GMC family oxidoreductase [Lysobacter sp.]